VVDTRRHGHGGDGASRAPGEPLRSREVSADAGVPRPMSVFWEHLKPQGWLIALSLLLAATCQALTMGGLVIFGTIIDRIVAAPGGGSASQRLAGVLPWVLLAVGIALLALVAKAFQEYATRLAVQRFGVHVFNQGLQRTLRLEFEEFEEQRSGETLSILMKVRSDTQQFVSSSINILFSSLVGTGFLAWYAYSRSWLLIPVFVIGVLVLGSLTGLLSRRIKTIQRTINRRANQLSGSITESLRNVELVRSLGLTFQEIARLRGFTEGIYELEMAKTRQVRTLSSLQGATITLLKHAILFILLWLILDGVLTTGELVTMQLVSTSLFGPLQDLGNVILGYREVEASIAAFAALMRQPIERRPEDALELGPLERLQFEEVVFRHRTGRDNAIDGISFEAQAGETIAFVGPSGSGKSTLVKLLVGLYRPASGVIRFNGQPADSIRFNPLRRQMGFVSQDTQLFAGTIRENLLFVVPEATDADLVDALDRAACSGLLARSSHGLDTRLGEGGMKLSGGEKQRISIARALLRRPRLLLFDEATSSLDSLTEEEITSTIREVSSAREQITILIAHRLSTIMHAGTIHVLEKGRIVESGTHQQLLQGQGLYSAMWRQQVGERRHPPPEPAAEAPHAVEPSPLEPETAELPG
jgi:ATP-binding cassette subfamily B protein